MDEAPVSALRVATRAREGYYNGLTFHRVVPNFVIQGGSPGANEYVGDGPYMRDEVGLVSHRRGTVGISTRGRDTGDAQIFVNLVDLPRLDHTYTVFAEVVSGMDVVDAILEGDVIERVELVQVISSRLAGRLVRRTRRRAPFEALARARACPVIDLTESNPTRVGLDYPEHLLAPLADRAGARLRAAAARSARRRARRCRRIFSGAACRSPPDRIALTASTSEAYALLFKLLCDAGRCGARATAELSAVRAPDASRSRSMAVPYALSTTARGAIDLESVRDAHRRPHASSAGRVAEQPDGLLLAC